jgi:hypothetical protein
MYWRMSQAIECLLCQREPLSSNSSPIKKKKNIYIYIYIQINIKDTLSSPLRVASEQ